MNSTKLNDLKHHLFICTHLRDGRPSCAEKGSKQLRQQLRALIKENHLSKEVKVTASGCLGYCEKGIAAVLHPGKSLMTDIHLKDFQSYTAENLLALLSTENSK